MPEQAQQNTQKAGEQPAKEQTPGSRNLVTSNPGATAPRTAGRPNKGIPVGASGKLVVFHS
ncbi:MAG: hypothetical protein LUG19_05695 [Desulfovibrio sp.]|uniref:hypothetical protein n=1 Tax=Desulfovibrio sp. TaxID=885 RepID=UPI00258D927C|nr:hypothetical protein [Desulfovibrio sp.]MCD7983734.1 hypothetical protein [Desulfovibrio sp.]